MSLFGSRNQDGIDIRKIQQLSVAKWSAFHEAASSVNRKCHFWFGFFFSFASISVPLHETRRRSRPRGVCAPKGSLDGRCVSCDFETIEAKEPEVH